MSTPANALDITQAGLVKFDGSTTFTGVTVTNHNVIVGAASNGLTSVAPSATSGVPLISQGAASDPVFGTVTVAGGGTGVATVTGVLTGNGTSPITGSAVDQYEVIVGGASNAVTSVGPGSAGQVLQSGGAASNPAYSTATYPSTSGTSGTLLQSNGTNFVNSTATYPSTAGTSGTILRANGTNWVASTATYPNTAGSSGNVLTSDGTNWISSTPGGSSSTANAVVDIVEDFCGLFSSSANGFIGNYGWTIHDWSSYTSTEVNRPGVIKSASGSFDNNRSADVFLRSYPILGGGIVTAEFYVKTAILSSASPRYEVIIGFTDKNNAQTITDPANGVWFSYRDDVNSGNWVIKTSNASNQTTANTAVAADTDWHVFKIVVNANASSVAFYIDDVEVTGSPIATNIPTVELSVTISLFNIVSYTAQGTILLDLVTLNQVLTTPR